MTTTRDAALHLLDRQIVDAEGRLAGKVDDLELCEQPDGRLAVTALLLGPGALGPRLGDSPGAAVLALWRRLHPAAEPAPARIAAADVADIGRVVRLSRRRTDATGDGLGVAGFERWARQHVVARIPGAGHEPD